MADDDVDHDLLAFMRQALSGSSAVKAGPAPPKTHVLESAQYIVDNSIDTFLSRDHIVAAAQKIFTAMKKHDYGTETWSTHELHPKSKGVDTVDFIFTMDLLNFSFWSDKSESERYAVEYRGKRWTGYWSLVAALQRALDEGIAITSPYFWIDPELCTEDVMRHVFRSATEEEIPMLKERLECLREAGEILCERYDGKFTNMIACADQSAAALVLAITDDIPCFRDEHDYQNRRVNIYKRAQILVADLWACFNGTSYGTFHDIDHITMFADYRVPVILHTLHCIQYSPTLESHILDKKDIPSGSSWELQIRGACIWAVECIRREIKKIHPESKINAILIDFYLYDTAKEMERIGVEMIPQHRCRSICTLAGDRVFLRNCHDPSKTHFTKPLTLTLRFSITQGSFSLNRLINAPNRSTIATHKGTLFRASFPTLEEYITNISRLVTPIYPHDAAVITSLLDIQPGDRVLEAGTGHGGFTSALLRVGADVTTVEKRAEVSEKAKENIEGYADGKLLRYGKADFRVGTPGEVMQDHPEGEFDVVFLDLPDPDRYFQDAARALRPDGVLAIWCPSVSQIMTAVRKIGEEKLPIIMDKTIEFPGGSGSGAGLRRWDVRNAVIRDSVKGTVSVKAQRGQVELGEELKEARIEMVCRPTVGERIVGGGFLGIFKRRLDAEGVRACVIESEPPKKRMPSDGGEERAQAMGEGLPTPPSTPEQESNGMEIPENEDPKTGHPELSELPPSPS